MERTEKLSKWESTSNICEPSSLEKNVKVEQSETVGVANQ